MIIKYKIKYMKKKILILGSRGMLGAEFFEISSPDGYELIGWVEMM